MKALTRLAAIAVLFATAALPALAAVEAHKDWDKSPEFVFLATEPEKNAWKSVASDADAEKFIALFWAKRDPDLKTPLNEFRVRFEQLVAAADKAFAFAKVRGALTERGKALILIGQPKRVNRRDVTAEKQPPPVEGQADTMLQRAQRDPGTYRIVQWTFVYEKEQLAPWTGMKNFEATFEVDEGRAKESIVNEGKVIALEKKASEVALVNPDLKEAPVYKTKEQVEAEQKAAAAAGADALRGPALTPAVRTELEGLFAKPDGGPVAVLPIAFRDGATRLMVQIDVPATAVPAPDGAKLAVLARSKDGKDAARVEEAAGLAKSKGDLYANLSLNVEAGEYDVAAVLLDASGAVLASGRRTATVAALPTEFATSPLILAYNDLEADMKKADDPFVFSGRRFIVKPEAKFDAKDGLLYAIRVYNPSVDPVTKTMFVKRSLRIKPKNGSAVEVPGSPDQPTPVPEMKEKGAIVLDLAGAIVDENIGDYFRPGDFELIFVLEDVVAKKTLRVATPFNLSGTLKPPAPKPAAAPAPKK
jgi:GWxTD domain-containing protein